MSKRLRQRLPALWITDAIQRAEDKLNLEADDHDDKSASDRRVEWAVMLSAFIAFFGESRAIQYFLSCLMVVVSIGIVYGDATAWTVAAFIILCPYLFIQSLGVLLFTGKKIKLSDDDLSYSYWKGAYLKYYKGSIRPSIEYLIKKRIALIEYLDEKRKYLGRKIKKAAAWLVLEATRCCSERQRVMGGKMMKSNGKEGIVGGGGGGGEEGERGGRQEGVGRKREGEGERADSRTWKTWFSKLKGKIKVIPSV